MWSITLEFCNASCRILCTASRSMRSSAPNGNASAPSATAVQLHLASVPIDASVLTVESILQFRKACAIKIRTAEPS